MSDGMNGYSGVPGCSGAPGHAFLGAFDDWMQFHYDGKNFDIEVIDANDMLCEVDRLHRDDALQCPLCGLSIGFEAARDASGKTITCGCTEKGAPFVLNPSLLRTLAERMKQYFKLERVSLNAAREFRSLVIQRFADAKKKREAQHGSPTGLESTPVVGPP